MLVAHLLGGNAVKGFTNGTVIINGQPLQTSYEELVRVCGNISLGDLDTSTGVYRTHDDVQNDYIELVRDYDDSIDANQFVIENQLTADVCYSEYVLDTEQQTLTLTIDIYE